MQKKYDVVATAWDRELEKPFDRVVGSFENYLLARMFKDAYNEYFSSHAYIVEYNSNKIET